MPDLIAQGPLPHHRWRRSVPADQPLVLGRAAGNWSTPWDERISRQHVEICWRGGLLHVQLLPDARNPVFHRGVKKPDLQLAVDDHFVIGETTFTLTDERANVSLEQPTPAREQTFSTDELRRAPYRRADIRIDALSRLPLIISGSATDEEMVVRLVSLLLAGIPRASAAAILRQDGSQVLHVLHWDRRQQQDGEFRPSERLIRQAISSGRSCVHSWNPHLPLGDESGTLGEGVDWAFCTPLGGGASRGWALYVAGACGDSDTVADPDLLRDDVKFSELAAATTSALRESRQLTRRQAEFSQFFSPIVQSYLAEQESDQALAPREVDVSVLFCDLRGFSRRSEKLAGNLKELLQRVSLALGVMTAQILQTGGVIGDFHGDAAMGFWGWPLPQPDAAERACRAALAIQAEFAVVAGTMVHPLADFEVGIGVATGRAVAGKIGSADQVKVTAFGPVVNLAARLEGITTWLHIPILLDAATAETVRGSLPATLARTRRLARVKPAGLENPVEVHQLLAATATTIPLTDEQITGFESAAAAFEQGDWGLATMLLERIPAGDPGRQFLASQIAQQGGQPPESWDGVIRFQTK